MKAKTRLSCSAVILFVSMLLCSAYAQRPTTQPSKPFAPDKMDNILYGVAYYPEYMP